LNDEERWWLGADAGSWVLLDALSLGVTQQQARAPSNKLVVV
jgi:hypothetical protein